MNTFVLLLDLIVSRFKVLFLIRSSSFEDTANPFISSVRGPEQAKWFWLLVGWLAMMASLLFLGQYVSYDVVFLLLLF